MSTKQETKQKREWEESFHLPNPGLRAYFGHVRDGQPNEFRTTFFKGKSIEEILKGWDTEMASIKSEWPSLYQFEIDLRNKVGPMSVMKPLAQRMDDIDAYYDLIKLKSRPIDPAAIKQVQREWGAVSGLRIKSEQSTVDDMKLSTNSGSPYFTSRKRVVGLTSPSIVAQNGDETIQILSSSNKIHELWTEAGDAYTPTNLRNFGRTGNEWLAPAILGWRGQEGGPSKSDVKQRVVWMFPFAVNIQELRVYQPLISAAQSGGLVPAWVSMESVDKEITEIFDTKSPSDLVICTDFSKFDQHFNKDLQEAAAAILSVIFHGDMKMADWINTVFPIKYHIPLAYDWERIRHGEHGMGSGSGGTNADETLVHRALQYEAALQSGQKLNPHSQCLGDDGVITYPGCTVEDVVRSYSSHGQEMNIDKQYASTDDCVYLRRWHHKDYRVDGQCVGVYSTYRALGRLSEQERYYLPEDWGPRMVALRQISILENVKYHPKREEFVRYCMKGDKYRLGLDIPGFLDNIERYARKATENMPDFLGYTKNLQSDAVGGIADWWIVKYLRSLR